MGMLRRLFGRRQGQIGSYLDNPLLLFSDYDAWCIKDACEGTQIFGATGSGKTSGSGQAIAKAFLNSGFGGLVLTAKPDERALWEKYCKETGREDSLIVFSPSEKWRFNFLDYEFKRPGRGAGFTENLVSLFCNVMEIGERRQGGSGDKGYWKDTLKQLLRNAIDLLSISKGSVSLPDIYDIILSAPQNIETTRSEEWQNNSFCFECITEGDDMADGDTPHPKAQDFKLTAKYWLSEFPSLAEKTRSIIVSTFTSMADCFLRGTLRELFCTTTNVVPEVTHDGAIILLDLPVKEYNELGQFSQVLFKYIWQRATERRDVEKHPLPVFLWADESQNFVTSSDMQFQTTARSSRACTVYLSQNMPNYYASLGGGDKAKQEIDSLMGNLQTKIFHTNGDSVTNFWASETIGKDWYFRNNHSTSSTEKNNFLGMLGLEGGQTTNSSGGSQSFDYNLPPGEFTKLLKGGFENNLHVEGVVFQGGRVWNATGKNYIRATFKQG